jgi:nucleoside-diphosphate-sugar epimerase
VINIGSGKAVTIGEMAAQIIQLTGEEASVEVDAKRVRPEGSEVMQLLCNNSKAKELLGWEPRTSFRDGLLEVIKFVQENLGLYKPDIYTV